MTSIPGTGTCIFLPERAIRDRVATVSGAPHTKKYLVVIDYTTILEKRTGAKNSQLQILLTVAATVLVEPAGRTKGTACQILVVILLLSIVDRRCDKIWLVILLYTVVLFVDTVFAVRSPFSSSTHQKTGSFSKFPLSTAYQLIII